MALARLTDGLAEIGARLGLVTSAATLRVANPKSVEQEAEECAQKLCNDVTLRRRSARLQARTATATETATERQAPTSSSTNKSKRVTKTRTNTGRTAAIAAPAKKVKTGGKAASSTLIGPPRTSSDWQGGGGAPPVQPAGVAPEASPSRYGGLTPRNPADESVHRSGGADQSSTEPSTDRGFHDVSSRGEQSQSLQEGASSNAEVRNKVTRDMSDLRKKVRDAYNDVVAKHDTLVRDILSDQHTTSSSVDAADARQQMAMAVQTAQEDFYTLQSQYSTTNFVKLVASAANMRAEPLLTKNQQFDTFLKTRIALADQEYQRKERALREASEQRRSVYGSHLRAALRRMLPHETTTGNGIIVGDTEFEPSERDEAYRQYDRGQKWKQETEARMHRRKCIEEELLENYEDLKKAKKDLDGAREKIANYNKYVKKVEALCARWVDHELAKTQADQRTFDAIGQAVQNLRNATAALQRTQAQQNAQQAVDQAQQAVDQAQAALQAARAAWRARRTQLIDAMMDNWANEGESAIWQSFLCEDDRRDFADNLNMEIQGQNEMWLHRLQNMGPMVLSIPDPPFEMQEVYESVLQMYRGYRQAQAGAGQDPVVRLNRQVTGLETTVAELEGNRTALQDQRRTLCDEQERVNHRRPRAGNSAGDFLPPAARHGTAVPPRSYMEVQEDMAAMEEVICKAEIDYTKCADETEEFQLLQAYYSRCSAIIESFKHAASQLSTEKANSEVSPSVEAALQRAHVWMVSTYGAHVPSMQRLKTLIGDTGVHAPADQKERLGLLAQVVASVLVEMNLQHPNGASGGIYPVSVFKMDDARMLTRVQCANLFLGAVPTVMRSSRSYGNKYSVDRPVRPGAAYVMGSIRW